MRIFHTLLLVLSFFIMSPAFSYYPTYIESMSHKATIERMYTGDKVNVRGVSEITNTINSYMFQANIEFKNIISDELYKLAKETTGIQYKNMKHAIINGNVTTKITTLSNGELRVEVGGFYLDTRAAMSADFIDFDLKVWTNTLNFSVDYNAYTGNVSNFTPVTPVHIGYDLSGNGILNGLLTSGLVEPFAEIFIRAYLGSVDEYVESILSGLNEEEFYVGGIKDLIPNDWWEIQGVDVGEIIKQLLAGIVPNQFISLSVNSNKVWYNDGLGQSYYDKATLLINVNNNYSLTHINQPNFAQGGWIDECDITGNCEMER